MSVKPGEELEKDQETDVQKTTEVVDSEDDEVGSVNTNFALDVYGEIEQPIYSFRMTPKLKILKTIRERVEL